MKILKKFIRSHPVSVTSQTGPSSIPIVLVQMPPEPDEKSFYLELLHAMNATSQFGHTTGQLRHVVRDLLSFSKTRMLMVDEVHSLLAGTYRQQRILPNTLRFLANALQIPMVCAGTAEAKRALFDRPTTRRPLRGPRVIALDQRRELRAPVGQFSGTASFAQVFQRWSPPRCGARFFCGPMASRFAWSSSLSRWRSTPSFLGGSGSTWNPWRAWIRNLHYCPWTPLRERALERKAADYSLASRRKPAKAPLFLMINEQNPAYFLKVKEWNPAHDSSFSSLRKTDNGDVPAVAAFDSGNLLAVANALHGRFPDKRIMIAGDDDHKLENNPGRVKALEAALAAHGMCCSRIRRRHNGKRD